MKTKGTGRERAVRPSAKATDGGKPTVVKKAPRAIPASPLRTSAFDPWDADFLVAHEQPVFRLERTEVSRYLQQVRPLHLPRTAGLYVIANAVQDCWGELNSQLAKAALSNSRAHFELGSALLMCSPPDAELFLAHLPPPDSSTQAEAIHDEGSDHQLLHALSILNPEAHLELMLQTVRELFSNFAALAPGFESMTGLAAGNYEATLALQAINALIYSSRNESAQSSERDASFESVADRTLKLYDQLAERLGHQDPLGSLFEVQAEQLRGAMQRGVRGVDLASSSFRIDVFVKNIALQLQPDSSAGRLF